jgi:iron complex outermembrane receptor protein
VCAQTDTVKGTEVVVTAVRGELLRTGARVQTFSTQVLQAYATASLGDLLAAHTPVFVKSYGPGSLSSLSFRGTGASHTAIVWNGFNLQSAMNGQTDVSMFPVGTFEQVSLQYGGNSALYGSGAIGGSLYLNNRGTFTDTAGVQATVQAMRGSFGTQQYFVRAAVTHRRRWLQTSYYRHTSDNDFEFRNTARFPSVRMPQTHAAFTQEGVVFSSGVQLTSRWVWNTYYWWHRNHRQLPPTMLQLQSQAMQHDESHRAGVQAAYMYKAWHITMRSGVFSDRLSYRDPLAQTDSRNTSINSISEAEASYRLHESLRLHTGLHYTRLTAQSTGYADSRPVQHRVAAFAAAAWGHASSPFKADVTLRTENISGTWVPLTFSAGIRTRLWRTLNWNVLVSRNYRYPTFNDLYWQPGGNALLKPEHSFNAESGLQTTWQRSGFHLTASVTIFSHWVDNWIMWLPDSLQPNIWTPGNIAQVWSRGVEYQLQVAHSLNKYTSWNMQAMYTWQEATREKAAFAGDASLHRQLIYIPRQLASLQAGFNWRNWQWSIQQVYTGLRFSSSDNYNYLPAFWLTHTQVAYHMQAGKLFQVRWFGSVRNVLNTAYQVMEWRAMPGRYIEAGLRCTFQSKIKQSIIIN